jgi:outer membrane protein assembly factor BamB
MPLKLLNLIGCLMMICVATSNPIWAADWPMWRYDAGRSAVSPGQLPAELFVQWTRELGTPRPAWPVEQDYQGKLEYDRCYEPIVIGKKLVVPSMVSDRVTAYDSETGTEVWRFYTDGPVRFAPVGDNGRVYFVSDDGHLYSLNVADGELMWKVRGGPRARAILGNERLISTWPARGAPVISKGTVYFAAGIWPFMGTFIHAVDAATGKTIWTNSGTGAIYNLHQHGGADAFGGVAPQGYFAVHDDRLLVAGGLAVPAVFDRKTGQFLHFEQSHDVAGKGAGGYEVAANGIWYFNKGRMYNLEDGQSLLSLATPLIAEQEVIGLHDGQLTSFAAELKSEDVTITDRKGKKKRETRHSLTELRKAKPPVALDRLYLKAGSRIYASAGAKEVVALDWPTDVNEPKVVWRAEIPGSVGSMLAADNRLFVVTLEGTLICYGGQRREPIDHRLPPATIVRTADPAATDSAAPAPVDAREHIAETILRESGQTAGYALVWGIESGRLVEELLNRSDVYVIAVDPDPARVDAVRRRLDDSRLYGRRAHVLCADPTRFPFPPYLANLVVSERVAGSGWRTESSPEEYSEFFQRLFHVLQPYGGVAYWPLPADQQTKFRELANAAPLPNGQVESRGEFATITRLGALPGAGQWTHQYNNSGNTLFSKEQNVKLPLGLLWFGGPSNREMLPRHGQGPIPHVVEGRLIIEGVDSLSARCVYTGRTLWRREFPDIGFPYKGNNHTFTELVYVNNQPGANFIGSNYVSLADGVYVVYKDECHRLNPETGETVSTFRLPKSKGEDKPDAWGYLTIWDDYLVAGAIPQYFDDKRTGEQNWNATSSRRVVVMNRHTGEVLWSRDARSGFRHNAIVPVAGKLFLIDRLSEGLLSFLARRGLPQDDHAHLYALDLQSGAVLWETSENIFGTWLGYSDEHDVLIQAGRTGGRESLADEPSKRIIAYRGSDGAVLWDEPISYTGPLVIHGDQIISSEREQGAVHLLTGKERLRTHPITGQQVRWTHNRTYGCGTLLACANLLTFRSGAAGYFDMARDSGTGNFGGFKSGCTPNLIPADGVLSAPDYTRTCSCSYQNQTSVALVPEADVELWTHSTLLPPASGEAVQKVGINFGAPGDRLAENGILWLDYPSVGGTSPDIPVRISGGKVERWFRSHSSAIASTGSSSADSTGTNGNAMPWVTASGLEGAVSLRLTLEATPTPAVKSYTVRLFFAEPDPIEAGQRVFDVYLQRQRVLESFDVVKQVGGPSRSVVREFPSIDVTDELHVELRPADAKGRPPVLCGIEIVRE